MREQMSGVGMWLDNSNQTATQTVEQILARAWSEGSLD